MYRHVPFELVFFVLDVLRSGAPRKIVAVTTAGDTPSGAVCPSPCHAFTTLNSIMHKIPNSTFLSILPRWGVLSWTDDDCWLCMFSVLIVCTRSDAHNGDLITCFDYCTYTCRLGVCYSSSPLATASWSSASTLVSSGSLPPSLLRTLLYTQVRMVDPCPIKMSPPLAML